MTKAEARAELLKIMHSPQIRPLSQWEVVRVAGRKAWQVHRVTEVERGGHWVRRTQVLPNNGGLFSDFSAEGAASCACALANALAAEVAAA